MPQQGPSLGNIVNPPNLKREQWAWYSYDWGNSAFSTTVVTLFLGLEWFSLCLYVLVGYLKKDVLSAEAAGEHLQVAAVGLDRDLRSLVAVAKEVQAPGPAVAEIIRQGRGRQAVRPGAAARPEFADP